MRLLAVVTLLGGCSKSALAPPPDTDTDIPTAIGDDPEDPATPVDPGDPGDDPADPPEDPEDPEDPVDDPTDPPDEPTDTGVSTPDPHDTGTPPAPISCSPLIVQGYEVCAQYDQSCEVVYEDGEGCDQVCSSAGLTCVGAYDNVEGECAAQLSNPLSCTTGHQSDYCVCAAATCVPDCSGATCGSDGCGGTCGTCAGDETCDSVARECVTSDLCAMGLCNLPPRCTGGDCVAFPGAEGEGRFAEGGRGGSVYHVTNLNNAGAGSFRDAVSGTGGPRTVVFDVAGIIDLNSPLTSERDNLTIAGQTAPGEGITFKNYQVELRGNDLIVQHVHFRPGDTRKKTNSRPDGFTEDSFTFDGHDVMIDHVSASWGIDECLSGGGSFDRVTIQWSIVSEGLHETHLFHGEVDTSHHGHSMGGLYKTRDAGTDITIHHNLFVSNGNRNPGIGNYDSGESMNADIRNNVLYNNRTNGYVSGESDGVDVNYVGNVLLWGPDSEQGKMFQGNGNSNVRIYQSGNYKDLNRNGVLDGFYPPVGEVLYGDYSTRNTPFPLEPVTTEDAVDAYHSVTSGAGAFPGRRDPVDERVVDDVLNPGNGNGAIIDSVSDVGGQPSTDTGSTVNDSDGDGMPNSFEIAYGTNPNNADHNGDIDGDGWNNLQAYLHYAHLQVTGQIP